VFDLIHRATLGNRGLQDYSAEQMKTLMMLLLSSGQAKTAIQGQGQAERSQSVTTHQLSKII